MGAGDGALGAGRCGSVNFMGRRRTGESPVEFLDTPVSGVEIKKGVGIVV